MVASLHLVGTDPIPRQRAAFSRLMGDDCPVAAREMLRAEHEIFSNPLDHRHQAIASLRTLVDEEYVKGTPGEVWGGEADRLERDL